MTDPQSDDAADIVRALLAAVQGFVALEVTGAFGLAPDVDRSFSRIVEGYILAIEHAALDPRSTS